jgi:hypothetical protein
MDTPNQIIGKLSEEDQGLLNSVLAIEKKRLHIQTIKTNSREEKEIVKEIVGAIDGAVTDVD